ncbi:hypothetical protein N7501_006880 [Penicillium viridicatum]|nr:hypothetical protein N7501_006880 [Penicillium viridicatum]
MVENIRPTFISRNPGFVYTLVVEIQQARDSLKNDLEGKKKGSFSLIERVILSAEAMLIFSVYFQYTICSEGPNIYTFSCFSLIERVILSAGAMLIFSVYFQLTICPEGRKGYPNSSL